MIEGKFHRFLIAGSSTITNDRVALLDSLSMYPSAQKAAYQSSTHLTDLKWGVTRLMRKTLE
jgi:hypothetical protein